ncbi:hypothetical protein [Halomonas litopenaei]|uniref:hypothetical protein n=1 Tax=Halomonas litopenaei TaxID=2109328 RepID=UPI001A8EF4EA|nr:hypothetical protein [Halomonas litopenaei]MBN8410734.1 hypothetical protein [Halomonas litopenaei]
MSDTGLTGINRVRLATNEYGNPDGSVRQVDQIEVHVMDMWLRKDINCARDIYLAERLADEAGVVLEHCNQTDSQARADVLRCLPGLMNPGP